MTLKKTLTALAALVAASLAHADVNVGVTLSATGPAASLGIPEKNTIALMPTTIGGEKVNYIVLDDASDTTAAVNNTRKLISENKVDIILGSTTTPNSLAMIDVAAESQTPVISMAASARIIEHDVVDLLAADGLGHQRDGVLLGNAERGRRPGGRDRDADVDVGLRERRGEQHRGQREGFEVLHAVVSVVVD